MNSFIESLNQCSENFLSFAWPMLWQSSLLIAALFAFDLLFRRKLRASIRYALWLVVLVKLCAPPTLALPTSPAWWLHQTPPPVVAKPLPHYTVTYADAPLQEMPQAPLPVFAPSKTAMNLTAWLLLASAAVSSALLGWLLVRWWQITRQVRQAATSERLTALADESQKSLGMKSNVEVKLTTNSMSPAVCGLFRPAILIPQSLAENFSGEQLRAVLLHELIHLRRRDVWVNFLQALLQIFYWWHPLVWLANARIRRVREEAVDDAVMLALRDEAESYAPTLLEVAKLALNRPLVSLGLVGIMESRHALRQRIERLVDFRAPRHAGLTLVSLLGILAFTAVAVPMAEGPAPAEKVSTPAIVPAVFEPKPASINTNLPQVLINAEIYQMRAEDFKSAVSDLPPTDRVGENSWWLVPEQFSKLRKGLSQSGYQPLMRPRILTSSGIPANFFVGDDKRGTELDCLAIVDGQRINLEVSGKVDAPVGATKNQFSVAAPLQNHGGVAMRLENKDGSTVSNMVVFIGAEIITNADAWRPSQPEKAVSSESASDSSRVMTFKLDGTVREDALRRALLDAGVKMPPTVFYYSDGGILLVRGSMEQLALVNRALLKLNGTSPAEIEAGMAGFTKRLAETKPDHGYPTNLFFTRTFKVDDRTFRWSLRKTGADISDVTNSPGVVTAAVRKLFASLGVDLESPAGKSVFYNDQNGMLFVRATAGELDVVEQAIQAFNYTPPQIHIKARFIEVPRGKSASGSVLLGILPTNSAAFFPGISPAATGRTGFFPGTAPTNSPAIPAALTGILTSESFYPVFQLLQSRKDTTTLAEPEIVTTSGRQAQVRVTDTVTIITNMMAFETNRSVSILPQVCQLETGVTLDVVPYVMADGCTLSLALIPSWTEFHGYAKTNAHAFFTSSGERVDVPGVHPLFRMQQLAATVNLWDNQTAVLGGMTLHKVQAEKIPLLGDLPWMGSLFRKRQMTESDILVFVTATIVDPAGNRVHADGELPFAQKGIPPQPK